MNVTVYRPTSATTDAIRAAILLARRDAAAIKGAAVSAKAERDGLLLDGSAAALTRAEADLVEARADVERLDAIQAELELRLVAATRAETLAGVEAAEAEVSAAHAAMNAFWQASGPTFTRMLGEALDCQQRGQNARDIFRARQRRAIQDLPDDANAVAANLTPVTPLAPACDALLRFLGTSPFASDLVAAAAAPEPPATSRLPFVGKRRAA